MSSQISVGNVLCLWRTHAKELLPFAHGNEVSYTDISLSLCLSMLIYGVRRQKCIDNQWRVMNIHLPVYVNIGWEQFRFGLVLSFRFSCLVGREKCRLGVNCRRWGFMDLKRAVKARFQQRSHCYSSGCSFLFLFKRIGKWKWKFLDNWISCKYS